MTSIESGCFQLGKLSQITASNSTSFSDLLLDAVVTVGLRLWCWGFKGLLLLTMQSVLTNFAYHVSVPCSTELHRHHAEKLCRSAADLPAQENWRCFHVSRGKPKRRHGHSDPRWSEARAKDRQLPGAQCTLWQGHTWITLLPQLDMSRRRPALLCKRWLPEWINAQPFHLP